MIARSENMPGQYEEAQDSNLDGGEDFADTMMLDGSDDFADTVILDAKSKSTDNVGMDSVEIDVESLLADLEAEAPKGVDQEGRIRRRLDAMLERKRRHEEMLDIEDYDLDS